MPPKFPLKIPQKLKSGKFETGLKNVLLHDDDNDKKIMSFI